MFNKVKSISERAVYSAKRFKEEPIRNLAYLLVIAMALTAIISGVVSYIMFVAQGGYSQQIELLKNSGFDGISAGFTNGTVGLIASGITSKVICGLVLAEFVVMMISYFKNNSKVKRIIMIVDLVFCAIVIALATVVFWIAVGELVITEQDAYKYFGAFDGMTINLRAILITYLVVVAISFITYSVLILTTRECRWMIGYTTLALLFANIAVPFFFLVLENIIPLVTGAITLVVIGIIISLVFGIGLSSSTSEGSSVSSSSATSHMSSGGSGWFFSESEKKVNTGNLSERGEQKRKNKGSVIEETCAYIPDINKMLGVKLWKIHGLTHDYIAIDNYVVTREICSLDMFEKGKFHIYESETGREIKSSEIPWMKQS